MSQNGGWTAFARKKVLDTPSLNATLTRHAIFGKKICPKGRCVRGVGGLTSLAKKDWIHLVYV